MNTEWLDWRDFGFAGCPVCNRSAASRIEARSAETPKGVQPEGREPDPKGDAQTQQVGGTNVSRD
jgi:hypothetical protein